MASLIGTVTVKSIIPAVSARAVAKVEAAVAKAAHDIEAFAKSYAPVDTGFLRANIFAEPMGPRSWHVISYAEYSLYVEFGTTRMAPRPFFVPAIERVRPGFAAALDLDRLLA